MDDAFLLHTEKTMRVVVYSDPQNILGLLARRSGLEDREYFSRNGKQLNNTELYQQFFKAMDLCDCQIIKVDGHKARHSKNEIDHLFSLVDKASRFALREFKSQRL